MKSSDTCSRLYNGLHVKKHGTLEHMQTHDEADLLCRRSEDCVYTCADTKRFKGNMQHIDWRRKYSKIGLFSAVADFVFI